MPAHHVYRNAITFDMPHNFSNEMFIAVRLRRPDAVSWGLIFRDRVCVSNDIIPLVTPYAQLAR